MRIGWETKPLGEVIKLEYGKPLYQLRNTDAVTYAAASGLNIPEELHVLIQDTEPTSEDAKILDNGSDIPGPKSRNFYLRTINALVEALIDGRSGKPYPDADAAGKAIASKRVEMPISAKTLGDYLSDYDKL